MRVVPVAALVTVCIATIAMAPHAFAQDAPAAAAAFPSPKLMRPAANVFAPPRTPTPVQKSPLFDVRLSPKIAPRPDTVCGMRLVPADPTFDASMRRAPEADRAFTMRTTPPPVCGR
jgi:hypothetical protein